MAFVDYRRGSWPAPTLEFYPKQKRRSRRGSSLSDGSGHLRLHLRRQCPTTSLSDGQISLRSLQFSLITPIQPWPANSISDHANFSHSRSSEVAEEPEAEKPAKAEDPAAAVPEETTEAAEEPVAAPVVEEEVEKPVEAAKEAPEVVATEEAMVEKAEEGNSGDRSPTVGKISVTGVRRSGKFR
ncbi:hypothetical protein ACLB2K_051601 [Fragaria x ananassa]